MGKDEKSWLMEISREILENKDLLKKALKNKDAKKVFHEWPTTELTYTSNAIEGSTLTRQETVLAITENLTGGAKPIKDYQAAINHAQAFDYVWKYAAEKQAIFKVKGPSGQSIPRK